MGKCTHIGRPLTVGRRFYAASPDLPLHQHLLAQLCLPRKTVRKAQALAVCTQTTTPPHHFQILYLLSRPIPKPPPRNPPSNFSPSNGTIHHVNQHPLPRHLRNLHMPRKYRNLHRQRLKLLHQRSRNLQRLCIYLCSFPRRCGPEAWYHLQRGYSRWPGAVQRAW
jgi:hypothetical protein